MCEQKQIEGTAAPRFMVLMTPHAVPYFVCDPIRDYYVVGNVARRLQYVARDVAEKLFPATQNFK